MWIDRVRLPGFAHFPRCNLAHQQQAEIIDHYFPGIAYQETFTSLHMDEYASKLFRFKKDVSSKKLQLSAF
jgi:hypothetical protein